MSMGRLGRALTLLDRAAPDVTTARKNMLLLIQLRWIAVGGQIATIAAVHWGFGVELPIAHMGLTLAGLLALNVLTLLRLQSQAPVTEAELFVALALDMFGLAVQLYLSGGATNPFAFLFLLQVTLGVVLLPAGFAVGIVAFAVLAFGVLTRFYEPLDLPSEHGHDLFALHIDGMFACFAMVAALLATFVARIARNLRQRDVRLAELRQQAAEEDHIVRMGLLASGAAHELGTPLATLDVILTDWRRMPTFADDPALAGELDDMRAEVRRCKAIVTGILLSAGEARGEAPTVTSVGAFFGDIVDDRREARAVGRIDYEDSFGDDLPIVADPALKQVLSAVIDNAVDASPRWVGVSVGREGGDLVLTVRDDGPGFTEATLADFGKPYNSSKGKPGRGLGLFLVVNVVRKLGGAVTAGNRPGGGAVVTLTLPLAALAIGKAHGDGDDG